MNDFKKNLFLCLLNGRNLCGFQVINVTIEIRGFMDVLWFIGYRNLTAITIKLTANTDLLLQTKQFFMCFVIYNEEHLDYKVSTLIILLAILRAAPICICFISSNGKSGILYKDVLNMVKECGTGFITYNAGLVS